jgi:hypothetical protein
VPMYITATGSLCWALPPPSRVVLPPPEDAATVGAAANDDGETTADVPRMLSPELPRALPPPELPPELPRALPPPWALPPPEPSKELLSPSEGIATIAATGATEEAAATSADEGAAAIGTNADDVADEGAKQVCEGSCAADVPRARSPQLPPGEVMPPPEPPRALPLSPSPPWALPPPEPTREVLPPPEGTAANAEVVGDEGAMLRRASRRAVAAAERDGIAAPSRAQRPESAMAFQQQGLLKSTFNGPSTRAV